jgi:hypothetical protein
MANILDLAERFIESKCCIAADSKSLIRWGLKNGLVKAPRPSLGTDYNWQLSRRIRRQEADKLKKQKQLKELVERCTK